MSEPTRKRHITMEEPSDPDAVLEASVPTPKDDHPKSSARTVRIIYRGEADVVDIGGRIIRPGEPVDVPSEVAEELLTMPFEEFEVEE